MGKSEVRGNVTRGTVIQKEVTRGTFTRKKVTRGQVTGLLGTLGKSVYPRTAIRIKVLAKEVIRIRVIEEKVIGLYRKSEVGGSVKKLFREVVDWWKSSTVVAISGKSYSGKSYSGKSYTNVCLKDIRGKLSRCLVGSFEQSGPKAHQRDCCHWQNCAMTGRKRSLCSASHA